LFSKWDNGAGRRQFQLFSPFDVFFPTNQEMRDSWTPIFAIYRADVRGPDSRSGSILWRAISWRHEADAEEFHVGPLFSVQTTEGAKRVALGNGLIGWKREPGKTRGRWFMFDFPRRPNKLPAASR
jgi:hypothetical protein